MFKKTKIAAVTAAILGLSSVALVPSAQAVSVNEAGSTGQVLVFPYYNVNNGFVTSFNITNTTDNYKAVKFRFRESNTSNDILDFNVYLSPFDMFTLTLNPKSGGGVTLTTTDKSCTHPAIPAGGVAFRDVYTSVENADMQEGYLEVIEMGEIDEESIVTMGADETETLITKAGVLHKSGTPINCGVIEAAWQQGVFLQGGAASNVGGIHVVEPKSSQYPDNATGVVDGSVAGYYGTDSTTWTTQAGALTKPTGGLAGSSTLIDLVNVAGFVAEPVSIVNYSATRPQHYLSSDENFYLLPSLASGDVLSTVYLNASFDAAVTATWGPVARDFGLDDLNVLPRTSVPSGINPMPMAHALAATSVANQYFLAGATSTDWVISAPMKKHGIFNGYEYTPAANNGHTEESIIADGSYPIGAATNSAADLLAAANTNGVWKNAYKNDVTAKFAYYDWEEGTPAVIASPGDFSPPIPTETPDQSIPFDKEVNILALNANGSTNASVLGSVEPRSFELADGFSNGWMVFDFSTYDLQARSTVNGWATAAPAQAIGVPLTGFAAVKGSLKGENLGEAFPHVIGKNQEDLVIDGGDGGGDGGGAVPPAADSIAAADLSVTAATASAAAASASAADALAGSDGGAADLASVAAADAAVVTADAAVVTATAAAAAAAAAADDAAAAAAATDAATAATAAATAATAAADAAAEVAA